MRLAVVTHNVVKGDGQGRANLEIVRHANRNGVKVTLFADRVDPALEAEGIEWVRVQPKVRSNWLAHGLEFVARANRVLDARAKEFDVIHGYGYCLDRRHHVNTSQFVHSAWRQSRMHVAKQHRNLYGVYQWLYSYVNAVGERRAFQKAKVIVAASSTVRREIASLGLGVGEADMPVILNGADPAEFHPGAADRAALGLPVGVPLGLFAGDIRTNRKNLDTVLKALARVPEMHLAVVGRVEGSPFPAMAESLGVNGRVHFLDFRRDIADIMRASDVFVFPSRYEACALVLVEAIASGLPVITAKTTGGAEAVGPEAGILVEDPDDEAALAQAMQTLAADPERRRAMGQAAAIRSRQFTWENIAQSYLDLYKRVAA